MSKSLLIAAAAIAAWAFYVEFGDQLPESISYRPTGDGRDTPAAPGIVNDGLKDAAGKVGN